MRRLPWPLLRLAAPVVPLFRELAEMRYLWQEPLRMPNDKLGAAIGPEPHTPLLLAIETSLGPVRVPARSISAARTRAI